MSSASNRGLMLTATLSILAFSGWVALHHKGEAPQTGVPKVIPTVAKEDEAEAQRKKEVVAQWLAEAKQRLEQTKQGLEKLKQQRQDLQTQLSKEKLKSGVRPLSLTSENSIEFSPVDKERSTWTGHTDPDRVWHDQREKARQTLIQFNLPPSASPR